MGMMAVLGVGGEWRCGFFGGIVLPSTQSDAVITDPATWAAFMDFVEMDPRYDNLVHAPHFYQSLNNTENKINYRFACDTQILKYKCADLEHRPFKNEISPIRTKHIP
jgi:hypothetical protein